MPHALCQQRAERSRRVKAATYHHIAKVHLFFGSFTAEIGSIELTSSKKHSGWGLCVSSRRLTPDPNKFAFVTTTDPTKHDHKDVITGSEPHLQNDEAARESPARLRSVRAKAVVPAQKTL